MDYFLLKQSGTVSIPKTGTEAGSADPEDPSVRIMKEVSLLEKFDYLAQEALVSDRLKLLLEEYLPDGEWRPCVFVDPARQTQAAFWFLPALPYRPQQVTYAPDGTLRSLHIPETDYPAKVPGIITISGAKGAPSVAVHLSVAESILRRGFCGLELLRLTDCPEEALEVKPN